MSAISERPVTDNKEQAGSSKFIGPVNGYWVVEFSAGARAVWQSFFTKADAWAYMDENDKEAVDGGGHLEAYFVEFNGKGCRRAGRLMGGFDL
jgi:hypothetical protein